MKSSDEPDPGVEGIGSVGFSVFFGFGVVVTVSSCAEGSTDPGSRVEGAGSVGVAEASVVTVAADAASASFVVADAVSVVESIV